MLVMKTTSAIYIILVLQTTVALAVSLSMYKSCLFECLHCVDTWGKDLFNGEACADSCAMSAGESIDRTCTSYFTRSVRRAGRNRQMSAAYADDSGSSSAESGYSRYGYNIRGGHPRLRGYRVHQSSLSVDCQRLCQTCESRFTSSMDAHSCMYTCVTTNRAVIAC
ncbi:hypothetical protein BaRGS_00003220 [Batillaria attramentaria]|uniref:Uncharacterized protein n=1 Tax=Batillaria attramentaria TaxID=370345 RepID=A0ABD0M0N1_9CAEN